MKTTNTGVTSPKVEEDIYRTAVVVRLLDDTGVPLAGFPVVWDPSCRLGHGTMV
jgi:hypothetical protein